MDSSSYSSFILLLFLLSIIILCHAQIDQPYITEPKLTSVIPVNSTALTVNWQFANISIDRSDLIRIYIIFYEFYYGYNRTYASNNYTFITTNKTLTSLTRNFELVNAYYYVCFSSNSSITNVTRYLAILNQCILIRTCLRSNKACPGPSSVVIQSRDISSSSFTISFLWPNDLPYSPNSFSAQLINNGQVGNGLNFIQNTSFTNRPYQFIGLQSSTTYTVNATFTYTILNGILMTNTTNLTITTSSAWKLTYPSDLTFLLVILVFNKLIL